ncbi:MAG: type II toxin-antitoxin system prevent-host-death family antitoxin [Acidobacteria bacterium]|nr:type II toxin-antitoxin system prevent-host-death family antitoxin [Acidobacteriota bacterium]
MQLIDIEQAKASLNDLLDAAVRGQEIILTRDAQPIAKIVPFTQERLRPRFGSARGRIHVAEDFDAPLADFDEYTR